MPRRPSAYTTVVARKSARCFCYEEDEIICGFYEGFCGCSCHGDDDYDADELGVDPEEEWDYDA